MKKYLLLFYFLFMPLFADDFDEESPPPGITPPSLINLSSLPSSIANSSVNVISGDFVESGQDLIVSGPDPYILSHTHSSSNTEEGTLADGWSFFHYHLLQVYQPEGINIAASNRHDHHLSTNEGGYCVHGEPDNTGKNSYTLVYLTEPSGHRLVFKGNGWAKDFKLITKNTGYTNVSGGEISGKTNIKNIQMSWHCKSNHWYVYFPDGTKRIYARRHTHNREQKEDWLDYHLKLEVLPSGNYRKYAYNRWDKISHIKTINHNKSRVLNWIHFEYKPYSLDISTSDNQNFYYFFKRLSNGDKIVSEIKRPGLPITFFNYCEKSENHERRIIKRRSEDDSFLQTKYYRPASNKVGDKTVHLNSKRRKFFEGRVREQKMPLGSYRYFYHKDNSATVKDAYDNITHYRWNEQNKRLEEVIRCDASWNRLMKEEFTWDKGRLSSYRLSGESYTRLFKEFSYDSRGNIIKETIKGEGLPKKISIHRTFSNDGFNNLLSEEDALGNLIEYVYHKNRNLLTAKFTYDEKKIKKREFFHYDVNACLIKKIIDDGSSKHKKNLRDVTERHITQIIPREQYPHFGEPRIIKHYALDLTTGEEIHLSSIINHFSKKGFIESQDLYDKENHLHSTTYYTHDDLGRITSTTDSLGRKTSLTYDFSGRLAKKETSRLITRYRYDLMGNLTVKEDHDKRYKTTLINRYQYDLLGRKIAHTNPQGHTTTFSYDVLNRVTKITSPQGRTKSYLYHRLGTIVTETDERKHETTSTYNAFGALLFQELPDGTKLKRTYDLKGNCLKENAPNGTSVSMEYDFLGRLTSSKNQDSKTTYAYNTFHLLSETSPTKEKISYTYDLAGRKTSQSLSLNEHSRTTTYSYDSIGRPKTETSHDITKSFEYDNGDRLIKEETSHDEGKTTKLFAYDTLDNIVEETSFIMDHPSTTRTSYDSFCRPLEHTDPQGNTWNIHYDDHFVNSHNDQVLKKRTTHPTGVFEEELYDIRGFLISMKRFDPLGSLISDKELNFDARGNCTRTFEQCFGGSKDSITNTFSYGPLDRLESMIEGQNNPEEKKTTFHYNKWGQKTGVSDSEGSSIHYHYDKKGRLQQFHGNRFNYSYFYDLADRITSIRNNNTNQETKRSYTPLGDLASETLETDLTTHYDYDNLGRVSTLTLPDNSKIYYNYNLFLKSISRNDWTYEITKRDQSGNILYDAFGIEDTASTLNPWRFSSKRVDPETGLVYFGRRYYDPSLGSWLTQDPLGLDAGPNLYAYVLNNPMMHFDLYGLDTNSIMSSGLFGISYKFFDSNPQEINNAQRTPAVQKMYDAMIPFDCSKILTTWENMTAIEKTEVISEIERYMIAMPMVGVPASLEAKVGSTIISRITNFGTLSEVESINAFQISANTLTKNESVVSKVAQKTINSALPNVNKATNAGLELHIVELTGYVPTCPVTGKPLPLPRNKHGVDLPSSDSPHTQIGWRESTQGRPPYRQTREWGYNGKPIKSTDWTDHTTPDIHTNPHDHPCKPNVTGGTPERAKAQSFKTTDEKTIRETL